MACTESVGVTLSSYEDAMHQRELSLRRRSLMAEEEMGGEQAWEAAASEHCSGG